MATHSSILAWRIPWTEDPGGPWSVGSQRVRHDWSSWSSRGLPHSSVGKESACNAGGPDLTPGSGRSPGEGKGYPLQYSSLENSMHSIVHGVSKGQTWLSDFHFHFHEAPGTSHSGSHSVKSCYQRLTPLCFKNRNENLQSLTATVYPEGGRQEMNLCEIHTPAVRCVFTLISLNLSCPQYTPEAATTICSVLYTHMRRVPQSTLTCVHTRGRYCNSHLVPRTHLRQVLPCLFPRQGPGGAFWEFTQISELQSAGIFPDFPWGETAHPFSSSKAGERTKHWEALRSSEPTPDSPPSWGLLPSPEPHWSWGAVTPDLLAPSESPHLSLCPDELIGKGFKEVFEIRWASFWENTKFSLKKQKT